ncbi:hypothetical protein [Dorea sp. OM07-5]|nr:hypothetical protein [Dorea sp. OM07-5]
MKSRLDNSTRRPPPAVYYIRSWCSWLQSAANSMNCFKAGI